MEDENLRSEELDGFSELADLVRQAKDGVEAPTDTETETETEGEIQQDSETETEIKEETSDSSDTDKTETETPEKKTQSTEDNARFAEMRRQQQIEQRVQEELNKKMQELPEVRTAKLLSEMYGMPIEQVHQQLEEAKLQREAQERNIPIEQLRAERERSQKYEEQISQFSQTTSQLQDELNQLRFQQWESRMASEAVSVRGQFPMISDADIESAQTYMLRQLKDVNMPLEQAIMALHGNKIVQSLRDSAKNEVLAEKAGRKPSPLAPQGGKSSPTATLTEEERYIAKAMGVSEEDYLKYK